MDFSNASFLKAILGKASDDELSTWIKHPELDWMDFLAFSGDRLVTPTVAARLLSDELRDLLTAEIHDALHVMLDCNQERNRQLVESFYRLTKDLNERNIIPMPLKGINILLANLYPHGGERVTSDIDVLIRPDEAQMALSALKQQGYLQRRNKFLGKKGKDSDDFEEIDLSDFRHHLSDDEYHLPQITHSVDSTVNFEIHIRPCSTKTSMGSMLDELTNVDAGVERTKGAAYRRPSDEFALLHAMHHMLVQDFLHELGVTDYRHLQDCRLFLQRIESNDAVDGLLSLVENTDFSTWLEFLLWQCQEMLQHQSGVALHESPEGLRLIRSYRIACSRQGERANRKARRFVRTHLPRLLNGKAIKDAYGGAPLRVAAPLYAIYQFHRLKHAISRYLRPKRG